MALAAGGTFLTQHCAIMAGFPRKLTDAVTCCSQPSRVMEPETKMTLHSGTTQATSLLYRVGDHKEMQHLRKCWILLKKVQLQGNPWQES